jgi:hypothetical protein
MGYEAFVISDQTREMLAQHFPPAFPEWVGHHITNRFGVQREGGRPFGHIFQFSVVGFVRVDGLEALVIARSGSTVRLDGGTYHLTWSLDRSKGFKPSMSNTLLQNGYTRIPHPIDFYATLEYLTK